MDDFQMLAIANRFSSNHFWSLFNCLIMLSICPCTQEGKFKAKIMNYVASDFSLKATFRKYINYFFFNLIKSEVFFNEFFKNTEFVNKVRFLALCVWEPPHVTFICSEGCKVVSKMSSKNHNNYTNLHDSCYCTVFELKDY